MQSFIVLGHGAEKLRGERPVVPPGCTLVLTEECGMLGTIPWQLYPVLADPANTVVFGDPVSNQAAVERLLGRRVRIYVAGEPYPILTYTLLSNSEDYKTVGPSGFYRLPTPPFVFQATKHGDKRYELEPAAVARAFEGSLVGPPAAAPASLKRLEKLLGKSQAQLFAEHPGVHYSLLCRALDEEGRIEELMDMTFPDADIFTKENADTFQAISHWLAALDRARLNKHQRSAVAEIEAIVAAVNEKRRRSGSPLGNAGIHSLLSLLALRTHPSAAALDAALSVTDINRGEDRHGYTPLMMAALHGHRAAVTEILRRGTDPNRRDNDGSTALMFGCTNGDLEICEILLAARADPTLVSIDGTNALHIACTKESLTPLIPRLLAAGLDPNMPDGDGDTPLHLAAGWGLTDQISALLAAGARPNTPNAAGETALAWAVKDGEAGAVSVLLPVSDVRTKGLVGLAIKAKQDDIAVALIEAGAPVASSPAGGQPVASWARVLELATERAMPRLAELAQGHLSRSRSSSERRRRTHRSNKPVF